MFNINVENGKSIKYHLTLINNRYIMQKILGLRIRVGKCLYRQTKFPTKCPIYQSFINIYCIYIYNRIMFAAGSIRYRFSLYKYLFALLDHLQK